MKQFREYLIGLRRFHNEGLFWNMKIFLLITSLIGIAIGFTFDLLLSFGFLLNMIRGVISIITGISLFSFSYLHTSHRRERIMEVDKYYRSVRERFSYRQRLNFSIVTSFIVATFILLGNNESPIFTLKSSLLIFTLLTLLAFTRRLRTEFIKDIYEIPDLRDLQSEAKRKRK